MKEAQRRYIYLPGAGSGGDGDLAIFAAQLDHAVQIETIQYPGWRRYIREDFTAEAMLAELTAQVLERAPDGPIRIIGISLGGHFGYAIALHFLAMGRDVELFCAIDSFITASSEASAGWQRRALLDAADMLRRGSFSELATFLRSMVWRILTRLFEGRLTGHLRRAAANGQTPLMYRWDPLAEQELSIRLMLLKVAPWVAELDRGVVEMRTPAILLRTANSAAHDAAWQRRCPEIVIREVSGRHETLFEPETMLGIAQAFISAKDEVTASPPAL